MTAAFQCDQGTLQCSSARSSWWDPSRWPASLQGRAFCRWQNDIRWLTKRKTNKSGNWHIWCRSLAVQRVLNLDPEGGRGCVDCWHNPQLCYRMGELLPDPKPCQEPQGCLVPSGAWECAAQIHPCPVPGECLLHTWKGVPSTPREGKTRSLPSGSQLQGETRPPRWTLVERSRHSGHTVRAQWTGPHSSLWMLNISPYISLHFCFPFGYLLTYCASFTRIIIGMLWL